MDKDKLSMRIGGRLRHIRQQRQLSLDQLAEVTGVSKPMLGQIERGASNPTVATLWKIAAGLQLPFTAFVTENSTVHVLRARDQQTQFEGEQGYQVYPTFNAQGVPFEMYRVEIPPGCEHHSEAHGVGVMEAITVWQGELAIMIDGESHHLHAKDAISFRADVPHVYSNHGDVLCELGMAIFYSASAHSV